MMKRSSARGFYLILGLTLVASPLSNAHADTLSITLAQESLASLATSARAGGSTVRGAVLFADERLACSSCHTQGATDLVGPDLTELTDVVTDTQLVESLLRPSKVIRTGFEQYHVVLENGQSYQGRIIKESEKQIGLRLANDAHRLIAISRDQIDEIVKLDNSAMPDNLIDQLESRQQFLDLLRYVMHLRDQHHVARDTTSKGETRELSEELRGQVLIEQYQCAACHEDLKREPRPGAATAPELTWAAGRIDPTFMQHFILEPHAADPGTTMPNMLGSHSPEDKLQLATALTHFIVSLRDARFERTAVDAVAVTDGEELFRTVGCLACHSASDAAGSAREHPLGYVAQKYNLAGLTDFLEDPHQVRPYGRMPNMQLTHWEAKDVASYLLQGQPTAQGGAFQLDATLSKKGREHFLRLGCVQCHQLPGLESKHSTHVVPQTDFTSGRGCLSKVEGDWPRYDIEADQKTAIVYASKSVARQYDDQQQILLALARFNCIACHERDGWGGVASGDEHFHTTNPNIGPQGRIPPSLTGVGAKLNPKWMRQVLASGRSIRPYMKTRMPQFGAENVGHLVDLFQTVDRNYLPQIESPTPKDDKTMRATGFELVSRNGLNCIACHTFQLKSAATMPAVDLTEMAERLHRNWFVHYMRDPQGLSPRTVMPSFWPGGQSLRNDIQDGDSALQIESLWRYLSDGRQARPPQGLVQERMELLATSEAVMLRRSWPQVGKRGIGVGYPNQVNQLFDAEQLRVANLWQGRFADPGGVWRSQGHGVAHPLEREQYRFVQGPDLDDATRPWIVDDGRPPNHQFLGYDLDELQRPAFRYRFESIEVTDYMRDRQDAVTGHVTLERTVSFSSRASRRGLRFRIASGDNLRKLDRSNYLVGRNMKVQLKDNQQVVLVDNADGKDLHVSLDIPAGDSNLEVIYRWVGEEE